MIYKLYLADVNLAEIFISLSFICPLKLRKLTINFDIPQYFKCLQST